MKKMLLLAIVLLVIPLSAEALTVGLTAHTFIYSGENSSTIFSQYEDGTLAETQYYTESEVSVLNNTVLGWLFDLPVEYTPTNPIYMDISSIYNGALHIDLSGQEVSSLIENYNGSRYLLHFFGAYGDMSLLTSVTSGVSYDNWNISRTMYLGSAPSSPVPEPSTILLLGAGLLGLATWRKKRSTPA